MNRKKIKHFKIDTFKCIYFFMSTVAALIRKQGYVIDVQNPELVPTV